MQRRAFTIIELMIVLVLLLALSAIAMPSLWSRVSKERVSNVTRAVTDAATDCRTRAMKTGNPVALIAVSEQADSRERARTTWNIVQVDWDPERPDAWLTVIEATREADSSELLMAAAEEDAVSGEREPLDIVMTLDDEWQPFGSSSRQMLLEQAHEMHLDALSGRSLGAADEAAMGSISSGIGGLADVETISGAIAVFLSDGTALPGPVSVFSYNNEVVYDVIVGAWSGVVTLERAELEEDGDELLAPFDSEPDPIGGRTP
ncbi:MAG: prepilin-type N-terminal cleavage/methylation domain-containing protein [Phycisphaeraceae bacterium]|nr:prepilin-type N-terminal cleavage/methylation domain-containing protein [Phycisphaerales bacterium]MCB9860316.1 prepilin-type N-terminal cleavage/methylation domain-containing protein [Phycisphaeraceae bacterium]